MAVDRFGVANQPGVPRDRHGAENRELEARLDRLLADPTVQLLMKRDGVEREVLLGTMRVVRRRIEEARRDTSAAE